MQAIPTNQHGKPYKATCRYPNNCQEDGDRPFETQALQTGKMPAPGVTNSFEMPSTKNRHSDRFTSPAPAKAAHGISSFP
jgi:hypothetical protein